jgi:hypothetical protein
LSCIWKASYIPSISLLKNGRDTMHTTPKWEGSYT